VEGGAVVTAAAAQAAPATPTMSIAGSKLVGAMRRNLELLAELEKFSPAEVDVILAMLLAHVRNWKPMVAHGLSPMPPQIEPQDSIFRELADGHLYSIALHSEPAAPPVALLRVRDDGDNAVIALDKKNLAQLRDDASAVLAALEHR
jgi:hypothetical protein